MNQDKTTKKIINGLLWSVGVAVTAGICGLIVGVAIVAYIH